MNNKKGKNIGSKAAVICSTQRRKYYLILRINRYHAGNLHCFHLDTKRCQFLLNIKTLKKERF